MEVSIYKLQTEQGGNKQVNTSVTGTKVTSALWLNFTHTSSIKILLQAGQQCENNLNIIYIDVTKYPYEFASEIWYLLYTGMKLLTFQLAATMKSFFCQVVCNPIFLTLVCNPRPIRWVSAAQSISISRPYSHASPQETSPDIATARRNWKPWCLTGFLTGQDH